jgi:Icc-related predicted phosphoesterase
MRILALTDIHGRVDYPETVADQVREAELVLIAGDITNFGDEEESGAVIRVLAALNSRILAIPGNCDRPGVQSTLRDGRMNLHATSRTIGNTLFFGIGGCNKSPFHTPLEYTEEEIETMLGACPIPSKDNRTFIVSHSPPHGTTLDKMFVGFHVGSKALRRFIEERQPDVVLCGHIHEARGSDHIGRTLIINPGPFPRHYALIDINGDLKFELH